MVQCFVLKENKIYTKYRKKYRPNIYQFIYYYKDEYFNNNNKYYYYYYNQ